MAKERVEVFADGGAAVLDDFRELRLLRGSEEVVGIGGTRATTPRWRRSSELPDGRAAMADRGDDGRDASDVRRARRGPGPADGPGLSGCGS